MGWRLFRDFFVGIVLFSFIQMTDTDFFVRMFSIFVVRLESIVLIDIFLVFYDFGTFCSR